MIEIKAIALTIFVICYFFILLRKYNIAVVSWISALFMVVFGVISLSDVGEILYSNWEILAIYWGIMVLSIAFFESGMPEFLAAKILNKVHTVRGSIIALCLLTAFISAFVENVAVVLLMAPIAVSIAKKVKRSVFPFLVSIAISSNLEGTLTLIGDPPAIIVALKTGMNFLDFFWFQGKPSIAIFVLAATVTAFMVLWWLFRDLDKKIDLHPKENKVSYLATILFILVIIAVALFPYYGLPIGSVGLAAGLLSLALLGRNVRKGFSEFDWKSFLFIMGVFVVVGAMERVNIINDIANWIGTVGSASPFIAFALITWISVLISGFVDNVPFVTLMVPVTAMVAAQTGISQWPLLFGMLIGSTVGGNITPVGASANIIAAGIIEKNGEKVTLWNYAKIGLPFTIAAVFTAFVLIWLVWM